MIECVGAVPSVGVLRRSRPRAALRRAAAACFVSQPALSEAIRKLELELNVPLVQRDHAFVGLTAEGERVVLWARRILADHDALKQEVSALQSGLTGQLRLGVIPAASTTATLLIDPFCMSHPLARVQLETSLPSAEVLARLSRFELDAGIVYTVGQDTAGFTVTKLYEEQQVLIASDALLGGPRDSITGREITQLPLCLLHPGMGGRQILDRALAAHDLAVDPQIETDSIAALYAHVGTGRWASVVPQPWTHGLRPPPGIRVLALREPCVHSPIALVIAAGNPGSVLARALLSTVQGLRLDQLFGSTPDAVGN